MQRQRRLPPLTYPEAAEVLVRHRELTVIDPVYIWRPDCPCRLCQAPVGTADGGSSHKMYSGNAKPTRRPAISTQAIPDAADPN